MEAGRELDALVAEKVMGWTITAPNWGNRIVYGPFKGCDCPSHSEAADIPAYSTDIDACQSVVQYLAAQGAAFELDLMDDVGLWQAAFDKDGHGGEHISADRLQAICYAALKFRRITPPGCHDGDGVW